MSAFTTQTHCQRLNSLLAQFASENACLKNPSEADGKCFKIAQKLMYFLGDNGYYAFIPCGKPRFLGSKRTWHYQATPEALGYDDRPVAGWASHYWCVVIADGVYYAIDFTCSQYGYTEFPRVREGTKDDVHVQPRLPKRHMVHLKDLPERNRQNRKIA